MKTVGYYAICESNSSSGVYKKINGFVAAANSLGYFARCKLVNGGANSHFTLLKQVGFAQEDIVIARGNSYGCFLLMFGILVARLRGKKVVLDIATPMEAVFREVIGNLDSPLAKIAKILGFILSGPWSFWGANRIVQYAPEGRWFAFGSNRKTILVGNGIDTLLIEERREWPKWPALELKLIGVAQVAKWHGYDLVIEAISKFNKLQSRKFDISFTIVGDGKELANLRSLAQKLQAEGQVKFTGNLQGEELHAQYDLAHIAVGSIGLHRKGMNFASELKAREYCAIGIPFFSAGVDPDFPSDVTFRYIVDSREDVSKLVDLFADLKNREFDSPHVIRRYAEEHLDFRKKVGLILNI